MSTRFTIANPCPRRWTDLEGEGRKRYCDVCRKPVHAIEQYSASEWDRIWVESNGHACGLICGESMPEPRSRRAVLAGSLLTAISPLLAQSGRVRIRVTDATGAVVVTAEAVLLDAEGKATGRIQANGAGEIVWTGLPMGDSRFAIEAMGFRRLPLTVTLRSSSEVMIHATVEVGIMMGEVAAMVEPLPSPPG